MMQTSNYILAFTTYLYMSYVRGNNDTCGCYMLGTFGSIDGESICDNNTFQCRCYRNVIGKNCDKCADGYYNILSGRGCSSCNCDVLGSLGKSCNAVTGQCRCKDGFIGLQCDRCAPYSYKFSSKKCRKCNCNVLGSKDLQCNVMGHCPCLPNVEGKQCDHCKENTYNIKQGCVPCPPCYEFVQSAIKNYTKYFTTVEQTIEEIEDNLPLHIQDYKHFLNEVKLLKAKIEKLKMQYEDGNYPTTSEETISKLNREVDDFRNEIMQLIKRIKTDFNFKNISKALYTYIPANLKNSKDLIKICESALKNATQISKSMNRHNKTMTKIAKDAIKASLENENKAEEYNELSINTTFACNETCSVSQMLLQSQKLFEKELQNLGKEILNTSSGAQTIKTYLEGFQKETKATKDEALQLAEKAKSLHIPITDELSNDLKTINGDLKLINETIENLTQAYNKIKESETFTEEYVEKVKDKQKEIDNKHSTIQEYENQADVAINKTNDILQSAKESLNKIEEYKKLQDAAQEASKGIPEIRGKINAVIDNSKEIQTIFQDLSLILKDLQRMQLNVTEILKLAKVDEGVFNNNFKMLEELEEEERILSKKLQDSHIKLKGLKNNLKNMKQFQSEIEYNITRMQEHILFLDTLPTSGDQLDEIEKEVSTMEEIIETIEYLTNEKEKLEKEIKNVHAILESLFVNDDTICESAKSEPKAVS